MTVSTSISDKSYTGNGVTTSFPLTSILFYDETHIKVYLDSVLQTSGYTVSGVGTTSGSVTFSVAPANLVKVYISRVVPNTQETDFANFDGNPSDVTEKQFDLTTMQIQQVTSDIADSILAPAGVTLATNRITGTVDSTVRLVGVSTSGPSTVDVGDVSASFDSVFTGLTNKDLITYNGSTWVNTAQINATNIPNTTITAAMLSSGAATSGQVPIANGSGGVAYGNLTSLTEDVITASDSVIFSDASDSGNTKRDTVQGILDLVPSAGGLVYLGSATASSSATLDFTSLITSTYDSYIFEFLHIASSSGASFDLRVSTNNGSSWNSSSGDYRWWIGAGNSSASTWNGSSSGSSSTVGEVWSSLTTDGFCGFLKYYQASGGIPSYVSSLASLNGTNSLTVLGGGCRLNSTYVNAIRFLPGSGTITSGTIRLYGIKKS